MREQLWSVVVQSYSGRKGVCTIRRRRQVIRCSMSESTVQGMAEVETGGWLLWLAGLGEECNGERPWGAGNADNGRRAGRVLRHGAVQR